MLVKQAPYELTVHIKDGVGVFNLLRANNTNLSVDSLAHGKRVIYNKL